MNVNFERVFVEIGGITETQPHGTDQVAFYRLRPDYTVFCTADYIKLPQQVRYVNCCVHQVSWLLTFFFSYMSSLGINNNSNFIVTCNFSGSQNSFISSG